MSENWVEFQAPKSEKKPRIEVPHLYATCDCEDFEWKQGWFIEQEQFGVRLQKSRQVMVARHTDLMTLPEMGERKDERWCVWYDELNILNLLCVTKGKSNRVHRVQATLDADSDCDWVCKHIVSACRWIARRMWKAEHVFVCWAGDRLVEEAIAWSQHQASGLIGTKAYRLANDIYVVAWGESRYMRGSVLFG